MSIGRRQAEGWGPDAQTVLGAFLVRGLGGKTDQAPAGTRPRTPPLCLPAAYLPTLLGRKKEPSDRVGLTDAEAHQRSLGQRGALIRRGEVLALGGLIRNTQTKGRVGLPFLSQIPFIGGLFGRQATGGNKIELIVLLKPRVIRTVDDGRAITDELRAKIKTLEPFKSSGKIP